MHQLLHDKSVILLRENRLRRPDTGNSLDFAAEDLKERQCELNATLLNIQTSSLSTAMIWDTVIWDALEPYDDSMPEILKNKGVYTSLVSDHYHYLEDEGCTYHNCYSIWENVLDQEGEHWKGQVWDLEHPKDIGRGWKQDWVNLGERSKTGGSRTRQRNREADGHAYGGFDEGKRCTGRAF